MSGKASRLTLLLCLTLLGPVACTELSPPSSSSRSQSDQGTVQVRIASMESDAVRGVHYEITCEQGTVIRRYVDLEDQGLPQHLGGTGDERFADLFFILPIGECDVVATAMRAPGEPEPTCEPATTSVTVAPDVTTELALPILCEDGAGAVDTVVVTTQEGDGLTITQGLFTPAKFVGRCQPARFELEVEGGDGNYTTEWEILDAPDDVYQVVRGPMFITLQGDVSGEYTVQATITDGTGLSASITVPIYIHETGNYETCDQVCCFMPESIDHISLIQGNRGILRPMDADSCALYEDHTIFPTEANGLDFCNIEVCCITDDGPKTTQASRCPKLRVAGEGLGACPERTVCCASTFEGNERHTFQDTPEACAALGGNVEDGSLCARPVCCDPGNEFGESMYLTYANECSGGISRPIEACTRLDVCCVDGESQAIQPADTCEGTLRPVEECTDLKCCAYNDGSERFVLQNETACNETFGTVAASNACDLKCCRFPDGLSRTTTEGLCQLYGGELNEDPACDQPQTVTRNIEKGLERNADCITPSIFATPSNAADQIAVYDLTRGTAPLATSPFETCTNPSRIAVDGAQHIYASCRYDGKVQKHTQTGVLLWENDLQNCTGSHAITLTTDGRLFAACSAPSRIFELDATTGDTIQSLDLNLPGGSVRGLASNAHGLWVAGDTSYTAAYITHTPTLQIDRTYDLREPIPEFNARGLVWRPVAVTIDSKGDGWFALNSVPPEGLGNYERSESMILHLTTTGIIRTYPITSVDWTQFGAASDLQWDKNGRLHIAIDGLRGSLQESGVIRMRPSSGDEDFVRASNGGDTPEGADRGIYHTRSVATDHLGRSFMVDAAAHRGIFANAVPDQNSKPFGYKRIFPLDPPEPIFFDSYAPSSDQNGHTSTCVQGLTQEITLDPIDSRAEHTTWRSLSWDASTPAGTSARLYYRIQGQPEWFEATSGAPLLDLARTGHPALQGRRLELKAVFGSNQLPNVPVLRRFTVEYD